jgi:hypothetical protein
MYARCNFDFDFVLSVVYGYTEDDMFRFSDLAFSVADVHPSQIFVQTFAYFVRTGISGRVGIDDRQLFDFLVTIRSLYNDLPYHNWFHARDALQFIYTIYITSNIRTFLSDIELFALFIAAICHDVDHNGFTNNFHRNAKTQLAYLAPNLPPLEHHHCCVSCDLLPQLLSSSSLSIHDQATVTRYVIDCIMATDMEDHKKLIDEWSTIVTVFDCSNATHRKLLGQMMMKTADLSNVVRSFGEAERQSKQLVLETRRQGKVELELGLPISPMCDPTDETPLCVGQVGFYKFVAGPLLKQVVGLFPELNRFVEQFNENLLHWQSQKDDYERTTR